MRRDPEAPRRPAGAGLRRPRPPYRPQTLGQPPDASTRGIGGGPLARALESFFCDAHLLEPGTHIIGWEQVQAADVEAYLATLSPATRARRLACLRGFFRFARSARAILADPTRQLTATASFPFRGQVLDTARQRALYRRWTAGADRLHPHEPAVGLLMLLHGASVAEVRRLRLDDVDLPAGRLRFASRPHPTPLDPATSDAISRCLAHLVDRRGGNRYLLVNKCSLTAHGPVATGYLQRLLAPAGVTPRLLRATRLAHLAQATDPILVAETFGVRHDAATRYLTDTVDNARLAGLPGQNP